MRVIRYLDCPPAPWKNGAGSTRELWRMEDANGVLIRISVAEIIGDQPFSAFPGIDRVILQLDGPPMVLAIEGQDHHIAAPFAFAGEADVACRLSAPGVAHDFNLMQRRAAFGGGMEIVHLGMDQAFKIGAHVGLAAFFALEPCVLLAPREVKLARWDLLLTDAPIDAVAKTQGRGVVITTQSVGSTEF